MSARRSYLKHLVYSEIQCARIDGRRSDFVTLVLDAARRARISSRSESSLGDLKRLLADTLRIEWRPLSPMLDQPQRTSSVLLLSDACFAETVREPARDLKEGTFVEQHSVGRPMEVLMIEDSLTFARITMGALRHGNIAHRFTWLTDGEEALEFLHRLGKYVHAPRPDLILLDLGLPKIDGLEVLANIKSDGELHSIPVVIMTASTSQADRIESERLSVEAFLTKPVDLQKFLELVRKLRSYWHEDMILPMFN